MSNENYLEKLLIKSNDYGKIGCKFIKENYWVIEYTYSSIKGYTILANDNHYTRFEIENWQKLERTTLVDILEKNEFIHKIA